MNTDNTLKEKFADKNDYPIWYYKELKEIDVNYVVFNLLKESFVIEIDGSKHEITFGKNGKGEIGQCIRYDDVRNSKLSSYKVLKKGFKEGRWFVVSNIDTTDKFKTDYRERKVECEKKETEQWYKDILRNAIEGDTDLNVEQRNNFLHQIEDSTYEELENLMGVLMNNSR